MGHSTMVEDGTSVEFGADTFKANATLYNEHKAIVDAASRKQYDNVEEAIAALRKVWTALEEQAETGAGYTPGVALGFGSENASVVAETILGVRPTTGAIRQAFRNVGK